MYKTTYKQVLQISLAILSDCIAILYFCFNKSQIKAGWLLGWLAFKQIVVVFESCCSRKQDSPQGGSSRPAAGGGLLSARFEQLAGAFFS